MIATDITRDKVRFSQTWNLLEDGRCFRVRIPIAIYLVNSIGISRVVRNELLSPRLDMKNILIRIREVIPVSHAINTKRLRIEPCRHHAVIRLTGFPPENRDRDSMMFMSPCPKSPEHFQISSRGFEPRSLRSARDAQNNGPNNLCDKTRKILEDVGDSVTSSG